MNSTPKLNGPDLTQGVELATIPDGTMLLGHALGEQALLARRGAEVFAIDAICTHCGAPLEQGLLQWTTTIAHLFVFLNGILVAVLSLWAALYLRTRSV